MIFYYSKKAIQYAKENNKDIDFRQLDIKNLSKLKEKFDFILEFGILHHIMPENRDKYVKDVYNLLNKNGKYLSVCFNEKSPEFGKVGQKLRKTPLGTTLYYSSQDELKQLFKQFNILENKIVTMTGNKEHQEMKHIGNYFFMERV